MVLTKLKEIREAKELTQEELARKADLTVRTIGGLEAGRGATLRSGKKLAKALGVKLGDLKGEGGDSGE